MGDRKLSEINIAQQEAKTLIFKLKYRLVCAPQSYSQYLV